MQGMGWLTMEELWWNDEGELMTHAPSTYKIPDRARRARSASTSTSTAQPNREETIHRSKAVGEPPLMLALSVLPCAARRDRQRRRRTRVAAPRRARDAPRRS